MRTTNTKSSNDINDNKNSRSNIIVITRIIVIKQTIPAAITIVITIRVRRVIIVMPVVITILIVRRVWSWRYCVGFSDIALNLFQTASLRNAQKGGPRRFRVALGSNPSHLATTKLQTNVLACTSTGSPVQSDNYKASCCIATHDMKLAHSNYTAA